MSPLRKRLLAFAVSVLALSSTLGGTTYLRTELTAVEAEPGTIDGSASETVQVQAFLQGLARQQQVDSYLEAIHQHEQVRAYLESVHQQEVAAFLRGLAPPPAPAPAPGDWRALVAQYPWNRAIAERIVLCESNGNANAYNRRSGATGLFQILGGPRDAAGNVARAYQMYAQRGWQPWNASRSCWS